MRMLTPCAAPRRHPRIRLASQLLFLFITLFIGIDLPLMTKALRIPARISKMIRGLPRQESALEGANEAENTITETLSPGEALTFLSEHVDLLLRENKLLHHKNMKDERTGGNSGAPSQPLDPEDAKICRQPAPVEKQPHSEQEWTEIVANTCKKYSICKEIPGVGVFGIQDLMLKDFNGLIHFKISGRQVRLVMRSAEQIEGKTKDVRENGCKSDTDAMMLRFKLMDYTFVKFEKERVKSTLNAMLGQAGDFETKTMTLPAGVSTLAGPFTIKLKMAMDARLVRDPKNGEWTTKRVAEGDTPPPSALGSGPHVCVRPISIKTGVGVTVGTNAFKYLSFGSLNVPEIIKNHVYCWFKYQLAPPGSPLSKFLSFVHQTSENEDGIKVQNDRKPIVSLAVHKVMSHADKNNPTSTAFNTNFKVATQLQLPTFPFFQWALSSAIEREKKRADSLFGSERRDGESGKASALSAGELIKVGLDHPDIDTQSLGEAGLVLNKYLNDLALIMSEKNLHATAGIIQSMANLIFDLDNDLKGILKGQMKLDKSEKVSFHIKEASLQGKVTDTRIPLSAFVQSLESFDGKRATDILQEATEMNCYNHKSGKLDGCPKAGAETGSVLVNGQVKFVDMRDVQMYGEIPRLVRDENVHEAIATKLFGAGESVLRTYLKLFFEFLRDNKSDFLWTSNSDSELSKLHHSPLDDIDQVSIDKSKIRCGGHFHYRGPFNLGGIGKRITSAINDAASGIARAESASASIQACLETAKSEYQDSQSKAAIERRESIQKCAAMPGPPEKTRA